jgi:TRAP-type mannitol/chloroaromatic compound transport system permease small subunit
MKTEGKAAPAPAGRWIRNFEKTTAAMNSLGTIWIFILLIIVNLDIGGRAIFNHPIRGVPEVVAMSITALVFLQIAHTIGTGRLTRSEVLMMWLERRRPKTAKILDGLYYLVGAGLFIILFWSGYPLFTTAWTIDEYVGAEGDFMAPTWPVKLVVLIGCVAGCIQFLMMAIDRLYNVFRSDKPLLPSEGLIGQHDQP